MKKLQVLSKNRVYLLKVVSKSDTLYLSESVIFIEPELLKGVHNVC